MEARIRRGGRAPIPHTGADGIRVLGWPPCPGLPLPFVLLQLAGDWSRAIGGHRTVLVATQDFQTNRPTSDSPCSKREMCFGRPGPSCQRWAHSLGAGHPRMGSRGANPCLQAGSRGLGVARGLLTLLGGVGKERVTREGAFSGAAPWCPHPNSSKGTARSWQGSPEKLSCLQAEHSCYFKMLMDGSVRHETPD